jgi:hypothetical protein
MAVNPSGPGAPGTPPPPPPGSGAGGYGQASGGPGPLPPGAGRPGNPLGGVISSEFAVLIVTAIGVAIAGLAADDIEPITVWILITVLSFGFIVSRGLAKYEHRHGDGPDHHH